MTKSKKGKLLYRATRDGFTSQAFHAKCDGMGNTITIIKSNFNYVFGGFVSPVWISSGNWTNDPNAFLFSLRRGEESYKAKFAVKDAGYAFYGVSSSGPTFGGGNDIYVCNNSNTETGSHTNFGCSYNLPNGYTYGENAKEFLAGNYDQWTTTEMEVYQVS